LIIQTKLMIPSVRSIYISRPQLYKKLDQGLNKRLTFITAPSGYGKTSALSEWVKRMETSAAWVTFDEKDNDSCNFWNHVAASLNSGGNQVNGQRSRFLHKGRSAAPVIAGLLNELNRKQERRIVIWDDFHHIMDSVVMTEINRFIKLLPDHVHLYLAGRCYPSLQLSKFKAANELIEIGKSDLSFTKNETRLFFSVNNDLDLRDDQLSVIHDKMEGWVTGLRLAALSLSLVPNSNEAIRKLTGRSKDFINYYFDEIMSCLDAGLQRFLYRTSILEEINSELCICVSEMPEFGDILPKLEQLNIFITASNSTPDWYRYHFMFRQFLQFQLRQNEPEAFGKLHYRAGCWMEHNGQPLQALHHFLEAGAYERMASLLGQVLFSPTGQGKINLRFWLERIPPKFLFHQPNLYILNIMYKAIDGELEESKRIAEHLRSRLKEPDTGQDGMQSGIWQSGLLLIGSIHAYKDRDYMRSVECWYKYIQLDPKEELFAGLEIPSHSIISLKDLHGHIGSLKGAEVLLRRYLDAGFTSGLGVFSTEITFTYISLLYEWNQLDQAERYTLQVLTKAEAAGHMFTAVRAKLIIAAIGIARGKDGLELRSSILHLQKSLAKLEGDDFTKKAGIIIMAFWIRLNNLDKAEEWLLTNTLSVTDEIVSEELISYQMYALLLLEQGKQEEAAELARKVYEYARIEGERTGLIRSLLLCSLVLYKTGNIVHCLNLLEEALYQAEVECYVRLFIDYGSSITEMLILYLQSRQNHHREVNRKVSLFYVKRLLQQSKGQSARAEQFSEELAEKLYEDERGRQFLTIKEQEVLQLIHEGLSNKLISKRMMISQATVKTHVNNMYKKLGVANRVLAVEKAKQAGLL
jgi:LuxR family transcriptional regulator, maltose regulon positive regulatory protein